MQTYPAIELIISDDGSDKFDLEKITKFVQTNKRENIVNLIIRRNEKNLGIPAHDNLTASIAKGKFIKFIADGDVFCDEDSLKHLYQFACQHSEWIVTSPSIVSNKDLTVAFYQHPSARRVDILNFQPLDKLYTTLATNNIISAVGCMFRKEFFVAQGFDEAYHYLEDWPCWLATIRNGHRIPCFNRPIERYALSGVSSAYASAFESPRLKQDLILCYEKEIMPNISNLTWFARYFVQYRYSKIKNKLSTANKLKFFPLAVYCKGKACIKKQLFIHKQRRKR